MSKDKACSKEGCTLGFYGKDLCKPHYMKQYRPLYKQKQLRVEVKDNMGYWEFVTKKLGISGSNERLVTF